MAKEWVVKCKDCGKEFGYSDWSFRIGETKGQSRPERCPECRKKHNRQTALMGAAYFDIKPRANADTSQIHAGSLGALSHPKREHVAIEHESGFDPTKFGVSDDDIRALIEWLDAPSHQVAVVVGPTGSGKSTALPYRLINPPQGIPEDRFTRYGQILITQPRIQATRNIPAYVAKDLYGSSIGSGFDVGFRYKDHPFSDWRNRLVYATDGTLINWIANGQIANLSVIMIDEAHERSLNIDLILGLLKKLLPRYPHLKLIVASATIDSGLFVDYFGKETAKLIEFQGMRKFKVDTYFQDESSPLPYDTLPKLLKNIPTQVANKVVWLLTEIASGNKPSGDILAFLQGERPIEQAVGLIRQAVNSTESLRNVDVFPLYTTLAQEDQNKALLKKPDPTRRRVVVTTNVAETSLTVEDIVYVVDSGLINQSQWQISSQTKQVITILHSQAGCKQRWGRAGRVKDGQAYCLYTEQQCNTLFPPFTVPEIQRSDLQSVVLAAKAAGIDNLTTFEWIQKPPLNELERAPSALTRIGALDADGYLTEHGLELQTFGDEPALGHLMAMADRFSCAVEMAILVAMMKIGGLRFLVRNDRKWDAATRREVNRKHQALMQGCVDDIELCLKIYAAWSDPDLDGQLFTHYWGFREIWPRYIPSPSSTLQEELGKKSIDLLRARAISANSYEDLQALAKDFGDSEQLRTWVGTAKDAMQRAKRESWARANFINHNLLKNKVEPARKTLLEALSGHKKDEDIRRVDFNLLDRVRIILAYCLPDRRYKLGTALGVSAGNAIANYQPIAKSSAQAAEAEQSESAIQINQDSVYYGKTPELFVCGQQQVVTRRIAPELPVMPVVYVSYLSLVRPEWISILEAIDVSEIRLARFIARQTRNAANGNLKPTGAYERLFLDQIFPLGTRLECRTGLPTSDGCMELTPIKCIADPIEILEDYRGDDMPLADMADVAENVDSEAGELVDTVLTAADVPVANPEEDIQPAWIDLEGHPADDAYQAPVQQEAATPSQHEEAGLSLAAKKYQLLLPQADEESKLRDNVMVKAEVIDYNFTRNKPAAILRIVPEPEPFEVFARNHKVGDTIAVKTLLFDQSPGDYSVSLVVQDPSSKLEIVLEPDKVAFVPRGFAIKKIPLGAAIQVVIEAIDKARRRVSLSCLPLLEEHLNNMIAQQRSTSGVFEIDAAEVGDIGEDRIYLMLPWSVPEQGLMHIVSVAGRGLYKAAGSYAIGDSCRVRISLSQNPAHRSLAEVPAEIASRIEGKQREFSNLSWGNGNLYYTGRMTNSARTALKSPSANRNYGRAIDDLYRFSNQLMVDTIDTEWPSRAAKYKVGQKITVKIVRIVSTLGAFAEIEPGLEGLIHKSKMAPGGVEDPATVVKVGDVVEVTIEKIDYEKRQIRLSMLPPEADPFARYKDIVGQRVTGTIRDIKAIGLFVELQPGIRGLVHISKVSNEFMTPEKLLERFTIGQQVSVVILKVDTENRRIELSMRA